MSQSFSAPSTANPNQQAGPNGPDQQTPSDLLIDASAVPLLPLTTGVVLPHMVVTIALETPESRASVEAALAGDSLLLLVPRVDGRFATVGTVARIETVGDLPTGQKAIVVRALHRAILGTGVASPLPIGHPGSSAVWLLATEIGPGEITDRVRELALTYRLTAETLLERNQAGRLAQALLDIDDPSALADGVVYWPELSSDRRIELLETIAVEARLELALGWIQAALAEEALKDKIRSSVNEGMEKQQRDFLLRQQMAAIRKELGDDTKNESAIEELRAKTESLLLPSEVRTAVEKELGRFESMSEQNPEQAWVRNWLETVLELPWGVLSTDRTDVTLARQILDSDTTGLAEGKDRIVEWLAVRSLKARRETERVARETTESTLIAETNVASTSELLSDLIIGTADPANKKVRTPTFRRGEGAIIALVGPPGVGKTSLGESIAHALNRSFVRVALGGVRDEAEIRGHRRTYVGAQSGRIVRALKEAKTMNPVVLLDEIDKLGTGWSGDPAAALLEVLDPAQNHTFRDHYLEVDLDLSDVVFVATANSLDTIPGPLRDRLEIINVDGYTDEEKVAIVRNHLLARQLRANGLTHTDVTISDAAIHAIVEGHTMEAGVRGLERKIGAVLRKAAVTIARKNQPVSINDPDDLRAYLGRPKRTIEHVKDRVALPGIVTGLAVTGAGGDVLFVEATSMVQTGNDLSVTVTGQLGDVMQESAQIALSYVRANADALGIDASSFVGRRVHIHFPAGAIPKDGPSAGITMTTALVSLFTNRPVVSTVAMTGEITLQGQVLPIGGVKQKLLAALRAGITTAIIPKGNEVDIDDLPDTVSPSWWPKTSPTC
jgi:ATP-dependent Lon protease